VSLGGFKRHMRESDSDVVRTLATQLNLGGLYAEEVCTRAGVEKETPIDDVTDQLRALHEALERIGERLRSGDVDPRVYEEELSDDEAEDRDPASSTSRLPPSRSTRGCRASASTPSTPPSTSTSTGSIATGSEEGEAPADASPSRPDFEEEIGKQERIVEQQQGAIEGFEEQAEAERERAELLYAEYDLVDEVLSTVQEAREGGGAVGRDRRNPRRRRGAGNPGGGDGGRCRRRRGHGDGRTPRR